MCLGSEFTFGQFRVRHTSLRVAKTDTCFDLFAGILSYTLTPSEQTVDPLNLNRSLKEGTFFRHPTLDKCRSPLRSGAGCRCRVSGYRGVGVSGSRGLGVVCGTDDVYMGDDPGGCRGRNSTPSAHREEVAWSSFGLFLSRRFPRRGCRFPTYRSPILSARGPPRLIPPELLGTGKSVCTVNPHSFTNKRLSPSLTLDPRHNKGISVSVYFYPTRSQPPPP